LPQAAARQGSLQVTLGELGLRVARRRRARSRAGEASVPEMVPQAARWARCCHSEPAEPRVLLAAPAERQGAELLQQAAARVVEQRRVAPQPPAVEPRALARMRARFSSTKQSTKIRP